MISLEECKALRNATNQRLATIYRTICNHLDMTVSDRIKKHLQSLFTCNKDHFVIFDFMEICEDVVRNNFFGTEDVKIMKHMVKFQASGGGPSPFLPTFAKLGITTPLIQYVINRAKESKFSAFDISDTSISHRIVLQIVLKSDIEEPVPCASRKRSRSLSNPPPTPRHY